jgi:hypothetical protein
MLPPLSSSTPQSIATTISSRAPSPSGYITLPPLKTRSGGGSGKAVGLALVDGPGGEAGIQCSDEIMDHRQDMSPNAILPDERVRLPGFSEIIRGADS